MHQGTMFGPRLQERFEPKTSSVLKRDGLVQILVPFSSASDIIQGTKRERFRGDLGQRGGRLECVASASWVPLS